MAEERLTFDGSLGGVPKVELLDGGVALLELGPELFPPDRSAGPLTAALTLVAPARALILDLRATGAVPPAPSRTSAPICSTGGRT
ncbi:hypothetical protein [Streptomyces avicenniae]|uniref:hypothetical protein n=1 Tax=Streptomyces avicenniae TaxID=500153 RepID=UPI00069988B9|nr:hypothetical protein [Streptomyces avicenniae]